MLSVKRKIALAVSLLLTIIVGCTGFAMAKLSPSPYKEGEIVEAAANNERISENCVLTKTCEYKMCQHSVTVSEPADAEMVGMNSEELREHIHGWEIDAFSADAVVMSRSADVYCPKHMVLKTNGSSLAILRTDSDTLELKLVEEISYSAVPESEKNALRFGKVFGSMNEIEEYLEYIES